MMIPMTLFLEDVVFFLTKHGTFFQVKANRVIGAGSHFTVETNEKVAIKETIERLRNTSGTIRKDCSVRLFHEPTTPSFDGMSHGLAFALAEFMIAHKPIPAAAGIDDRVEVISPDDLQIVATGVIELDGRVLPGKTEFIVEKIEQLLTKATGTDGSSLFKARRKIFILPKASNSKTSENGMPANETGLKNRADALRRLEGEDWVVHEIDNIFDLKDLYDPVKGASHVPHPKPQGTPRHFRFGVLLGVAFVGIAIITAVALQNPKIPWIPLGSVAGPGANHAPADPPTSIVGPDDISKAQPAFDEANIGAQFTYRGHLTLEIARVRENGSLGLILSDAHRFVREDRVALILTHKDSNQNALVIVRREDDAQEIVEVFLTPSNPSPQKSFDISDLVGTGGGLKLFATNCLSDCKVEADGFREWSKKNVETGLNGRTGNMDGSAPLILNAKLELQEDP